ncbi:YgfZ/GcvT domain-containing protein [Legionella fairfieldensis]|uniref:CAF17-like 4Fe-4S cluster assembly/insertion protein YgfZ n=1 Tax=Legionella fairfieldensis TaxID=45064 RepID=UPI00048D111B|nr:folate-binding protein YgfZ [Legionella fairfieldensis]
MNFSQYCINSRPLTTHLPLSEELLWEEDKNYLFDLSFLSSLRIEGEHAAEFLQGQLSCDIRQVTSKTIRQGAMCNLKGRILALTDVIDWHGLRLVLPCDLLADTQASLAKTAMLSRVKPEPDRNYQLYGFYLGNTNDLLPYNLPLPTEPLGLTCNNESCCYRLDHNFFIILNKKQPTDQLTPPFINNHQFKGALAWHHQRVQRKNVQIYPETRGLFLPHRLNLHLSGYLNFEKGCYKGQEIIARTHYRAKLKHDLQVVTIETREKLSSGKKIFDISGKMEIGELIDYSPLGNDRYLVVISVFFEHPNEILIEGHPCSVSLEQQDSR